MSEGQLPLFELEEPPQDIYPTETLAGTTRPPRLTSVEIDGLKGFDHSTVELKPLTVLTGPNNCGKSTVLQAIALAFECFRRCLDVDRWSLKASGRAVSEFDFLPVNQPKDLWFRQIWKPARDKERNVRVGLSFEGGFRLLFRIRFMYGFLNIGLEIAEPTPDEALLRSLAGTGTALVPATPGPSAHEDFITLAQVHRMLGIREPSRVIPDLLT